jgi:hypothetical protein
MDQTSLIFLESDSYRLLHIALWTVGFQSTGSVCEINGEGGEDHRAGPTDP